MLVNATDLISTNNSANKKLVISTVENHPLVPFATKVMRQAYKKLGYDIEVWPLPAARALYMSSTGRVDAELGRVAGLSKQYKTLIQISPGIVRFKASFISTRSNKQLHQPMNNQTAAVVLMRGMPYANQLIKNRPKIEVTTIEQVIKMLESQRAQYALIDGNYLSDPRYQNILAAYNSQDIQGSHQAIHHYIHNKHAALAEALNQVLADMRKQGLLGH
ncbi:substrate-binding periplasmic protein [Catenovulum agarivorans]|nr:transporter substrate-binding domain-containing protein [Catenovulum agarivorans]